MPRVVFLLHLATLILADSEVPCDDTKSSCHARPEKAGKALLQTKVDEGQGSHGESNVGCKPWCKKDNCGWKACASCDECSVAPPVPSGAKCEGNCAAAGTVTVSDGTSFQSDQCGVTKGGPYSPTTCPMEYLGWAAKTDVDKFCEGNGADGPWVEVDLGALTTFNTIEVVQPQRKTFNPPGYCGLEVWVDGESVYSEPGYTASPAYSGANQVTTVTGAFTGQTVKVKYGRSAKNPTAHLYGINVFDK